MKKKETHGGATDDNHGAGFHSSSTNQRRSSWAQTEKTLESGDSRSTSESDNASVERLREAVNRSSAGSRWQEIAIIVGSILLVACIATTLLLASGINARANRIIADNTARDQAGAEVVTRLEGKLDAHSAETLENQAIIKENQERLNSLTATTTTTASRSNRAPTRAPTATTRPVSTTRPTPPTTSGPTPTTAPRPTTPTTKPCQFALLNLCLVA